jgi:hypothetical protein
MSHAVIIIRRNAAPEAEATESSYEYSIPIPHEATPQQVGELVRKAYKRLEASDD